MDQHNDRSQEKRERSKNRSTGGKDFGYATTSELIREAVIEEIPITTRSYLKLIRVGKSDRLIELRKEEIVIGRDPECGIHIPEGTVSRRHVRVFFRNEEYHVEDLRSANGTYVNGIQVVRCALRNNDQIDIGEVKMLFHEDQVPEEGKIPL
jgi:pSer/pThr/pTyr-binding forkhead associated (FHA) protein